MARIQFINRTKKTEGKITLRFRLRDGREVDLYHKSEIEADLSDLSKFEADGTPKKRANFNRDLHKRIMERLGIMQSVYDMAVKDGRNLTNEAFELEIDKTIHPEAYQDEEVKPSLLIERFQEYLDSNTFAEVRTKEYKTTIRTLQRFLLIKGAKEITIDKFSPDMICDFHTFLINEYQFATKKRYAKYYADVIEARRPTKPRKQNTVQSMLKMLKAFYANLEETDEVAISPFRKLGKKKRADMLREEYNTPIALTLEEVQKIINTDVPATLQCVKDAFLLQVALGCRISDYVSMDMSYIKVSNGIPYVAYIAKKTGLRTDTPLPKFAFDIIKRTDFKFPILKYVSGKSGYNKMIKQLIEFCEITREVEVGKEGSKILYAPIADVVSSKTGRKTNVTLCADAQIDKAVMGLHEHGSKAIANYDAESLSRKFKIISFAFRQPLYKVDENLNLLDD